MIDDGFSVAQPSRVWKCGIPGCRYEVRAWTVRGIEISQEIHMAKHKREDEEERNHRVIAYELRPKRNFNIFRITVTDIAFFKSRGIGIGDNWELDIDDNPKHFSEDLTKQFEDYLEHH